MELPINQIIQGDCLEVMAGLSANSVDTIITDPPYGLEFMGKEWDKLNNVGRDRSKAIQKSSFGKMMGANYETPRISRSQRRKCKTCGGYSGGPFRHCSCKNPLWIPSSYPKAMQQWHYNWGIEALRVLKPGGTMLIFGGTRTYHRLACGIEDAGFILKDCIMWLYGSGFPKATDISKQLDKRVDWSKAKGFSKKLKEARISLGLTKQQAFKKCEMKAQTFGGNSWFEDGRIPTTRDYELLKKGLSLNSSFDLLFEEAKREIVGKDKNWGEKGDVPLSGYKEFDITKPATPEAKLWNGWKSHGLKPAYEPILVAMKPNDGTYANNALVHGVSGLNIKGSLIKHDEPVKTTTRQENTGIGWHKGNCGLRQNPTNIASPDPNGRFPANVILDEVAAEMLDEQSGASRFFYCAKASHAERNAGCEEMEAIFSPTMSDGIGRKEHNPETATPKKNHHPTVKPLALMEYLCKLTATPTGGIVLDPFAGSGTTCVACVHTERDYIGIERETEYAEIAKRRIAAAKEQYSLLELQ